MQANYSQYTKISILGNGWKYTKCPSPQNDLSTATVNSKWCWAHKGIKGGEMLTGQLVIETSSVDPTSGAGIGNQIAMNIFDQDYYKIIFNFQTYFDTAFIGKFKGI